MKECINCNALLEDDELFCHECGTKQEIIEEKNKAEESIALEVKFCIHCGEKIEADSTFCPLCGKPQEAEEINSDEHQANKAEEVEAQTEESVRKESPKEEPKVEEPKAEETKTEVSPPQGPKTEDEPTNEREEEKKSKAWIWILLVLLIAGGAVGFFFMTDPSSEVMENNVELSDSIRTSPVVDENAPTSALAFLDQFYKGEIGDDYVRKYVTANVINKLKRDFGYDCPSNDCLATWVFTAYPAGADLDLEEGPIITKTDTDGQFKVDFKYSGYNGDQKTYETRTVFLTVIEMDGKYLISDYELDDGETKEETEGLLSFEDALKVVDALLIEKGNFKGFKSPDVNEIMNQYGYSLKKKYFVEREFLFEYLFYKNCSLAKSLGADCYSEVPFASGNGAPSFVGIDNSGILIAPFEKAVFEDFMNQVKDSGATLKEEDDSVIVYNYKHFSIIGYKSGVFGIKYCISISKDD